MSDNLWPSEKFDPVVFKHRAGEISGCEGAGIQVYPVVVYLRLAYRRVAVDHNLSEAPLIGEKIVSYPEKIVGVLVGQIHPGSNARVHKEIITQLKAERQRDQKIVVMSRQSVSQLRSELLLDFDGTIEGRFKSIGGQRLKLADMLPMSKNVGSCKNSSKKDSWLPFRQIVPLRTRDESSSITSKDEGPRST